MTAENENEYRDDLTAKAEAAFEAACWKVIEVARQTGTPIVIWRDGRIVHLSCEEAEQILRTPKHLRDKG